MDSVSASPPDVIVRVRAAFHELASHIDADTQPRDDPLRFWLVSLEDDEDALAMIPESCSLPQLVTVWDCIASNSHAQGRGLGAGSGELWNPTAEHAPIDQEDGADDEDGAEEKAMGPLVPERSLTFSMPDLHCAREPGSS